MLCRNGDYRNHKAEDGFWTISLIDFYGMSLAMTTLFYWAARGQARPIVPKFRDKIFRYTFNLCNPFIVGF